MNTVQHLALVVRDLETTRDFFVNTFDYTASEPQDWQGAQIDELTNMHNANVTFIHLTPHHASPDETTIAVQRFNEPASPSENTASVLNLIGYRHIGFLVDDIEGMYEKLKSDWKFFSKPVYIPWAKLTTVYFYGPEEMVIQLMQKDADSTHP